jgi:hypothetical protein
MRSRARVSLTQAFQLRNRAVCRPWRGRTACLAGAGCAGARRAVERAKKEAYPGEGPCAAPVGRQVQGAIFIGGRCASQVWWPGAGVWAPVRPRSGRAGAPEHAE